MDRASLEALGGKLKPLGTLQALGMTSIDIQTNNGTTAYAIGGVATFATATKNYTMTLQKEGETYKVAKFDFP